VLFKSAKAPPAVFPWASLGVGFGGPPPAGLLPTRSTKPAIPIPRMPLLDSLLTAHLMRFDLAITVLEVGLNLRS